MFYINQTNSYQLVGIIGFRVRCQEDGFATRIYPFIDWIRSITQPLTTTMPTTTTVTICKFALNVCTRRFVCRSIKTHRCSSSVMQVQRVAVLQFLLCSMTISIGEYGLHLIIRELLVAKKHSHLVGHG